MKTDDSIDILCGFIGGTILTEVITKGFPVLGSIIIGAFIGILFLVIKGLEK